MQQPNSGRVTWTSGPDIGGIVHYYSYGIEKLEPRAAIVTAAAIPGISEDGAPRVSLCVLKPSGLFFDLDVPYAAQPKPGHWSWPPRWEVTPGACDHVATALELLGRIGNSQPAEMSSTGRDIQLALIHSMLAVAEGLKAR